MARDVKNGTQEQLDINKFPTLEKKFNYFTGEFDIIRTRKDINTKCNVGVKNGR